MLLQRLYQLRQNIDYDTPESYKKRDVHFAIELDQEGGFLDIARLGESEGKKQALVMATPDRIRGGSAPPPLLFVDKPQYLLGVVDPKEKAKALPPEDAHQFFVELVRDLFASCTPETVGYELLRAAIQFLESDERQRAADELTARYLDREIKNKDQQRYQKHQHPEKNCYLAMRVDGEWLHNLPCVQQFWAQLCREETSSNAKTKKPKKAPSTDHTDAFAAPPNEEEIPLPTTGEIFPSLKEESATPQKSKKKKAQKSEEEAPSAALPCLITGEYTANIARLHDEIRLGAQPCQIISANSSAFLSYGHEQSFISPVSQDAMKAYVEALRYLLAEREHHASVGGTVYVFWSKDGSTGLPLDIFDDVQPIEVAALLRSPFSGRQEKAKSIQSDAFYAAALRSNKKRMIIRDYLETTLEEVKQNLTRWFEGHAIAAISFEEPSSHDDLRYFGLKHLASAFTRQASREMKEMEKLSPLIFDALFHTALHARPLPLSLLSLLMLRIRSDGRLFTAPQRAALLRVLLNSHQATEIPMTPALDTQQHHPAYLCGRLFAVLEDLQRAALGKKINATIADRFMGTASSAPASVFGRLLRGAQPHLQFLRKNNEAAHYAIQKRIEDILQDLPSFPSVLDLKSQGLFALGYYHQRHATRAEIRTRKELQGLAALLEEQEKPQTDSEV